MRRIKYILTAVLFGILFLIEGLFFQKSVLALREAYPYFLIDMTDDPETVMGDLQNCADCSGVDYFICQCDYEGSRLYKVVIHATEGAERQLGGRGLQEGNYSSLLSGTVEIQYADWRDVVDTTSLVFVNLIGKNENLKAFRAELSDTYNCSRIKDRNNSYLEYAMTGVPLLIIAFLLIVNWYDIQLQRKKIEIYALLGASKRKECCKNMIQDLSVYFLIALFCVLAARWTGENNRVIQNVVLVMMIFCVIHSAMYCIPIISRNKAVLADAHINGRILTFSYLFKPISVVVTLTCLGFTILNGTFYVDYEKSYQNIATYEKYSTIEFRVNYEDVPDEFEDSADYVSQVKADIFYDAAISDKVAIASSFYEDSEYGAFYFANENTDGITSLLEKIPSDYDGLYYTFIPKRYEDDCENIAGTALDVFNASFCDILGFEEGNSSVYSENIDFTFFDNSVTSETEYGISSTRNPIIIVILFHNFPQEHARGTILALGHIGQDIMYEFSEAEISEMLENYDLREVNMINVGEHYAKTEIEVRRKLALEIILSTVIMLLNLIFSCTIIKTEYVIEARKLAIQVVLGYSLWERNKLMWKLMVISILGGTIFAEILFSRLYGEQHILLILLIGILLLMIDLMTSILYLHKVERRNVMRIVKGDMI